MSFLPSFSSLGGSSPSSTSTIGSSSQIIYKPASLSYFTIFCPALKPPKHEEAATADTAQKDDTEEEDEDARETAREAAQILFYTSRARAVLKDRMLRQIGVAKGMIEFCSMVSKTSPASTSPHASSIEFGGKGRTWNIHSSKRRMILVEVQCGLWVHASIDLPHTTRPTLSSHPKAKMAKEYHDSILQDAWIEESIRRAWRDWTLLNGCPAHILSQRTGRAGLERSLEKYFSVWAWSWDLELATNADVAQERSLFTECLQGFPVVASGPRSKLTQLMQTEAAQRLREGKHGRREMVVLKDTNILWPATDAGCFHHEEEIEDGHKSSQGIMGRNSSKDSKQSQSQQQESQLIDPATKAQLLRRVVSHLTGLQRERDLIRAASVSSNSDAGRRRGASGAIRERGSSKRDTRGLLSANTNIATSKKRVVSSPIMQQRSASASSFASSTTTESNRWSNWGSVFGLGKLGFRAGAADSSLRSETTAGDNSADAADASNISILTSNASGVESRATAAARQGDAPTMSSPVGAPAKMNDTTGAAEEGEASTSPLQVFAPVQEAGGKIWSGAELAFRGLGASLGLANASASASSTDDDATPAKTTEQEGDISERERFANTSFDTNGTGADADASVVTKVSVLEPEVDVSELAEALGVDEEELAEQAGGDAPCQSSQGAEEQAAATSVFVFGASYPKTEMKAAALNTWNDDPMASSDDTQLCAGWDGASIKTSASTKAFPSISVTSAAWYNTKALGSDPAVTASSPKLAWAASMLATTCNLNTKATKEESAEAPDTSLGGISVSSEHHDFELDGWGYEQPLALQSFRCFVGDSDLAISYESLALLQEERFECGEYRVSFTTRRLLTLVLIEKVAPTVGSTLEMKGSDTAEVLDDAWKVLRRTQRILNDYDRLAQVKVQEERSVRFLHLDGQTLTYQSSLENKVEEDVQVVSEAHCVGAMELMHNHAVVETFARSSNGKTLTASRRGKPARKDLDDGEKGESKWNQTYMVLAGKKMSIVDCDTELRRLANQYPSFGI
ncbi:hypothetical protein NDA18_006202 [Ustilago nuda]|nr:hypothetical protein NDA18_006202 [Ustilago nuda]